MEDISRSVKQECLKDFPCYYRRGRHCFFWVEAGAISEAFQEAVPPTESNCYARFINIFDREPCKDEAERRRQVCPISSTFSRDEWPLCERCGQEQCTHAGIELSIGHTLSKWLQ